MDDILVLIGFTSDGGLVIRTEERNLATFPSLEEIKICAGGFAVLEQVIPVYVESGGPGGPFAVGRVKFRRDHIMPLLKAHTTDLSILLLEVGGKPRCDPVPFVVPSNLLTN